MEKEILLDFLKNKTNNFLKEDNSDIIKHHNHEYYDNELKELNVRIQNHNDKKVIYDWMILLNNYLKRTLVGLNEENNKLFEENYLDWLNGTPHASELYFTLQFTCWVCRDLVIGISSDVFSKSLDSIYQQVTSNEGLIQTSDANHLNFKNNFFKMYFLVKYSKQIMDKRSNKATEELIKKEDMDEVLNQNDIAILDSILSVFYFSTSKSSARVEQFFAKTFPNISWKTENELMIKSPNLFKTLDLVGINTQNSFEFEILRDIFNFFKEKTIFQNLDTILLN